MIIAPMTFRLYAPWVHSLKEKRMIVKKPDRQASEQILCVRGGN